MIREYIIKEKIGTGSYGVVYKVTKKTDKKVYVLKQISLFGLSNTQISEVKNEAEILSKLDYHYIVKYHDSFEEKNFLNIVMEYCDDGDLDGLIQKTKIKDIKFDEDKIWDLFIQISLGLGYLHKKKVLHRDLKSLNIFLTKDRGIKIGDLGVAKILTQGNFAKTFIGTPYYLSPEICEEKQYNEKSDVWALGCILYEMCTFKHPFEAKSQGALILKIVKGKYEPIGNKYSNDMNDLLNYVLQKNEITRPNVSEILKKDYVIKRIVKFKMVDEVINLFPELKKVYHNKHTIEPENNSQKKFRDKNHAEIIKHKNKEIIINIDLADISSNQNVVSSNSKRELSNNKNMNNNKYRKTGSFPDNLKVKENNNSNNKEINKRKSGVSFFSNNKNNNNNNNGNKQIINVKQQKSTNAGKLSSKEINKNIGSFETGYQKNKKEKENCKNKPSTAYGSEKNKIPKQPSPVFSNKNNIEHSYQKKTPKPQSEARNNFYSDIPKINCFQAQKKIPRNLFEDSTTINVEHGSMKKLINDYLPNKKESGKKISSISNLSNNILKGVNQYDNENYITFEKKNKEIIIDLQRQKPDQDISNIKNNNDNPFHRNIPKTIEEENPFRRKTPNMEDKYFAKESPFTRKTPNKEENVNKDDNPFRRKSNNEEYIQNPFRRGKTPQKIRQNEERIIQRDMMENVNQREERVINPFKRASKNIEEDNNKREEDYQRKNQKSMVEDVKKEKVTKKQRNKGNRQEGLIVSENNFTDSEEEEENINDIQVRNKSSSNKNNKLNNSDSFSDNEDSGDEVVTVKLPKENKMVEDSDSDSCEKKEKEKGTFFQTLSDENSVKNNSELKKKLMAKKIAIEKKLSNTKMELINLIGKESTEYVLNFYKAKNTNEMDDESKCESIELEIHKKYPDKLEAFKTIFYLLLSNDLQLESIKEDFDKLER